MIPTSVLDFAKNINPEVIEKDITPLAGGYSSQAYKIEVGGDEFVLLTQRKAAVVKSKYGHSFVVLKLLEATGYKYSPKAVWLHPDETAMAITFFEGEASDEFDFKSSRVDPLAVSLRVIDAILDTAKITKNEYDSLCDKLGVQAQPTSTTLDLTKEIGVDWFSIVEKDCPDQDIVEWLRPRIISSVEYASNYSSQSPTLGLGDPSNPNILLNKSGDFMLIDWDSASYNTEGPEYYISYTTHLTDFMKPFKKEIIEHVANRIGVSFTELDKKVFEYGRYYQVFDINWAAMMMAKVASGAVQGDINKFRKITSDRIADYENSFESPDK